MKQLNKEPVYEGARERVLKNARARKLLKGQEEELQRCTSEKETQQALRPSGKEHRHCQAKAQQGEQGKINILSLFFFFLLLP